MGCTEDQYNIENISFTQDDLYKSEKDNENKTNEDKKKNKRKSRISKNKDSNQKSDISPITNTLNENDEENNELSENNTETENSKTNENKSNEKSKSESKDNISHEQSNNTKTENSQINKSSNTQKESKTSSDKKIEESSDKKSIKIDSNSKSKSISISKSNNDSSSKSNSNSKSDNKNSNLIKEDKKEEKTESGDSNKDISEKKDNKDNNNADNKNNVIVNEDWLEGFINETNAYDRLNIKSSISPKDPILSELIASKEKELIISSEDIISYHHENPSKKYKVVDLLGSGSFGKVFKGVNTLTRNLVAIKKTKKYLKKKSDFNSEIFVNVRNEIEILKKLSHPNIVKIYEIFDIREYYFQINEYCKFSDLYNYFKFHLSEKQICIILYQILSGILYLHENNIVHRDIKLENILVDHIEKDLSTSEPYFFIKIADFGSSKYFVKEKKESQIIGTCYYIAPEVIKEKYNEKCDIWSAGIVLYMLITKKAPFEGNDPQKIFDKITNEEYNKHSRKLLDSSEEVRDLLDKLLEKNYEKRLSAREALDHPWFKKFHGRSAFSNFKFEDFNLILDRLFNFKYLNKLQDLVISYLVHNSPSNEENIKIMKIFRYFNTSGDCKLTRDELKKGLYRYRLKSEVNKMVDELFTKLEIKKEDDYIEYEKFISLCIDKNALFTKENLKDAFNYINYDKGEGITAGKIMRRFNITDEDITRAVFNNLIIKKDNNNDMIITYSEFEKIIRG